MKQRNITLRLLAALLAALILGGCAAQAPAVRQNLPQEKEPTGTTAPTQLEMPQDELDTALRRIEYSALAAAFSLNEQLSTVSRGYYNRKVAYITDTDGDGCEVFVYGSEGLTLTLQPDRYVNCGFTQGGFTYFTDNEGNLYQSSGAYDSCTQEESGQWYWYDHESEWYSYWNGSQWVDAFQYYVQAVYPLLNTAENDYDEVYGYADDAYDFDNPVVYDFSGEIYGQPCTAEELQAHFEQIGLTEITVTADEYTQNVFDPAYTDSLLAGLDAHLSQNFSSYTGSVTADIDSDGFEETLFLVPRFDDVWYDHADPGDEYGSFAQGAFLSALPESYDRTAVLVADQEAGQLVIQACCALEEIYPSDGMQAQYRGGFLWLNGRPVCVPGIAPGEGSAVYEYLSTYLESFGCDSCFFKAVDITEFTGAEYMCLYQKDGTWYLVIFVFEDGSLTPVYSLGLYHSAVFLVEQDGKQCLLTYSQQLYTTMGGMIYTGYNYNLFRIGTNGEAQPLDFQSVGYYDNEADATAVAQFFEKLNVYLIKIIVLRDPYALKGRVWMEESETDYGTVPEEPEAEKPQEEEYQLGFVQIEDPSSWLNLRVGPGTEYDCVLMDPSNPDSIVRQALGSPVTILETIETDDPEHPVWLKIRIRYQDQDIIGYSSRTYIRLASEG